MDRALWREEISSSLTYFRVKRVEKRECAIAAIQVNAIGDALGQLRSLNGMKSMYAQAHGREIKGARWKNAEKR